MLEMSLKCIIIKKKDILELFIEVLQIGLFINLKLFLQKFFIEYLFFTVLVFNKLIKFSNSIKTMDWLYNTK